MSSRRGSPTTSSALKYRILRAEPQTSFLIYREGARPDDIDNWLLDIELAHGAFRADQIALWRADLALPERFDALLRAHREFFRAAKRLEKLKARLRNDDTETMVRLRMLAVSAGSDGGLDTVLEALLSELAEGEDEALKLIERVGLTDFLWKQAALNYGYRSDGAGREGLCALPVQGELSCSAWARRPDLPPTRRCSSGAGRATATPLRRLRNSRRRFPTNSASTPI